MFPELSFTSYESWGIQPAPALCRPKSKFEQEGCTHEDADCRRAKLEDFIIGSFAGLNERDVCCFGRHDSVKARVDEILYR